MSMEVLPLLNYDKLYQNTINKKVVICDTSSFTSSKQMTDFMRFVFSNGDIGVALGASCECGKSEGIYLLNTICPYCKTVVEKPTAQNLKYSSWIEIPDFLPPLLQPAAYRDLKTWMGTFNKSSLLLLLMTQNSILPECIASWYTPGLWSFYYNFDKLVEFLLIEYKPLKEPNIDKKTKTVNEKSLYIREFVSMYRECLFARYFPILDQRMHVKNNQGTMSFVDKASEQIVKSIIELANIHYHYTESKMEYIEKCAIDMINSYYEYSDTILSTKIQKKLGLIRRHILGARCHFTYRGVIVPITDAADGDELYLPWGIGVQQHKLEILNILVNRMGYTSHDAQMLYERSKYKYDPIIDGILDTLIKECPYKGLVTILGRNPTL